MFVNPLRLSSIVLNSQNFRIFAQIFNIIFGHFFSVYISNLLMKITSFQYGEQNLKFCFVSRPIIRKQNVFIFPSFLKWYFHWTYNSRLTVIFSPNRKVIFLHFFANHCCDWKINQYNCHSFEGDIYFPSGCFLGLLFDFLQFHYDVMSETYLSCLFVLLFLLWIHETSWFSILIFSPFLKKYFLC